MTLYNAFRILTVDVEDWFQVENFKGVIKEKDWNFCELRIVENIKKLLDLFERNSVKCTFFVLGWIAKKVPYLIKEIYSKKHEIASHGFWHNLIYYQTPKEFEEDIIKSKKILEDIIGEKIIGYRAPSFSITDWAIYILVKNEFIYDSSYCPFSMHKRYGKLSVNAQPNEPFQFLNGLIEIPISTLRYFGINFPWGGGAYFRLIPYPIFKLGIKRIQKKNNIYVFYFHPWEIDFSQPRIKNLKLNYKIRHYGGLKLAYNKIQKLLKDFSFISIKEFLNNNF